MSSKRFWISFSILSAVFSAACTVPKEVVPFIAGDATKVQLLQQNVGTLHKAIQWGDPVIAGEIVSPALFPVFYQKMIGDPRSTKVLDLTLSNVELDKPKSGQATATADIRVYGSPSYVVKNLTKKEIWEFSRITEGGWTLIGIEDGPKQ